MRTLGILPASGIASRMGGLPKFLLPIGPHASALLDLHLEALRALVDDVVVAVHPKFAGFMHERTALHGTRLTVVATRTMSETILQVTDGLEYDACVIGLPDVYLADYGGYRAARDLVASCACALGVWVSEPHQMGRLGNLAFDGEGRVTDLQDKVAGCPYTHHWGVAAFTRDVLERYTDPAHPHIGFTAEMAVKAGLDVRAAVVPGGYFDCGTTQEYTRALEHSLGVGPK